MAAIIFSVWFSVSFPIVVMRSVSSMRARSTFVRVSWAVSSNRAILSSVAAGAGADILRSSTLRLREVSWFSQFFEKFDNRVRVHRYCRLKSVLFSLFALLLLTAPFFGPHRRPVAEDLRAGD